MRQSTDLHVIKGLVLVALLGKAYACRPEAAFVRQSPLKARILQPTRLDNATMPNDLTARAMAGR